MLCSLLRLSCRKKITCWETTINISSLVTCIFDLEMRSLELVTDFAPICFEKNVHFLARDNKSHGRTPDK